MKKSVLSTYKVLMSKSLNHSIDESWVNWAIEMIEAGFESENLYILAGVFNPYNHNQFELHQLTSKVLEDLELDYSNKDLVVNNYVYYLISDSINKPETYFKTLLEIKNICIDLDMDKQYMDFYLLFFAKDELIESENQWYWDGADRSNIDVIIKNQFDKWKTEFELTKTNT